MKTLVAFTIVLSLFLFGFTPKKKDKADSKPKTYKGTYESKRGVMDVLSCHCFDGGVLTLSNGKEIAVCFEKSELEKTMESAAKRLCEHLEVTGKMVEHTIAPADGEVCSPGTVTYLKVKTFRCLD